ncbi:MAG: excinuclease ABC subunit UvrC [Eubacterium sp.]|nr:excinuclease ABC subunit UvrC [Eubacterium sp.]
MFDIQEELKKIPDKPGVYLMHDRDDHVIYVGKAVVLKNRVRQYFQKSRNVSAKIEKMIQQIAWFEYIVTDSELEALVLECNLIKEYNPKYNTMLKDGKGYPFLKATVTEDFPRLMLARQMKRDGAKYFGPFTSGAAIRDTIELTNKLFSLRSCKKNLPRDIGKDRPCLYYEMGQCKAPCQGYISSADYKVNFDKALKFLGGDTKEVLADLQTKMMDLSAEMKFEEAALYRDLINSVTRVTERQKITSSDEGERDIIAIATNEDDAVVQVFFIRGGRLIGREHYFLTGVSDESESHILGAFIKQMYAGTPYIPKEIWAETEPDDMEFLADWLEVKRGGKVQFKQPKRGQKGKLLDLAKRNATMILTQDKERLAADRARTIGAVEEIEGILGIDNIIRIESYDISNINGFETVGSMVVFENGRPKKNNYRKFRIKSVTGPDDYHSMEELLTRRFTHGMREGLSENDAFKQFPSIIFMDGGKGQVNVCKKVLDSLGINIPVCGMVKDDRHRTRGLYFENVELPIDTHSQGFRLITRIQDETHRFAIEYHKQIRGKKQVHSVLDDIPGIGAVRRKALMRNFESIEAIKSASIEELKQIPEINEAAAKAICQFFGSE